MNQQNEFTFSRRRDSPPAIGGAETTPAYNRARDKDHESMLSEIAMKPDFGPDSKFDTKVLQDFVHN